jgi:hypothetical protein
MKRRSIHKTVQLLSAPSLLVIATLQPLGFPQGGAREAYAEGSSCISGTVAPGHSFSVPHGQAATVSNDDATPVLGPDVLTATTVLTITPLRSAGLPALHQGMRGMTNVTNVTNGPRYDSGQLVPGSPKETETYLLSGEELAPVFNRGALVDRVEDRVFHTRVESQFSRIIRHGADL